MYNQEQLAAIAAAMSILQHSLQSNSPTDITTSNQSQLQQQQQHQQELQLAPTPPKHQNLVNQYQFHQDINLTPSPPKQNLDQQHALVNQYITQMQQHQQQQQQQQDIHINSPPKTLLQQQQHQQVLVNHYQSQLQHQQQQDLHINTSNPKQIHQHRVPQAQHHQQALVNHYQSQLQHQQQELNIAPTNPNQIQQQQVLQPQQQTNQQQQQPQQQVLINKTSRPISYSAIVAKSTGLNNNNHNTISTNNNNNNNINNSNNNNININNNNVVGVSNTNSNNINGNTNNSINLACNNTFGGLSNSNFSANVINPNMNSDTSIKSVNNHTFRGLGASNGIVRNSLTNHMANSTNIFNTNTITTGNGLGPCNGSLLNHSNNLLALEPTINYTTDHSISPAQQLFNRSQDINNQIQIQANPNHLQRTNHIDSSLSTNSPSPGSATNLLGFMGLYVGNLSPDLTKEQLEKIFSKYGEPVKAHRLVRSPVAFIKYENTESPRAAIDDLHGLLLPELTLNQDQPLKLHFDRNDAQLKANYRPTELPAKNDNGECYGWRTTVCRRGKNCPKKHIPINRGIDFQMWMIKSTSTTS